MKPGVYKTFFKGKVIPLTYVTETLEAEYILSRLSEKTSSVTAIDTETAALPNYRGTSEAALSPQLSKVRLLQIYTGEEAFVFDIEKIGNPGIFTSYLEEGHFIGHASVFDLQYFYKQFGITKCNIGCTYLLSKLLIHATSVTDKGLSASLRNLVNVVFEEEILKEMQTSDWSEPELTFEQVEYAALDAISTYYLAERLAPKLEKFGLTRVYQLYKDAQHAIAKMQLSGLTLNVPAHGELVTHWTQALYKARCELHDLTGLSYITPTTLAGYLERHLPRDTLESWPHTETGKLSTDANTFADFDFLDIVKPFSKFQKLEKLCTSFGTNLIEQVNPETGRLHAHYNLAGARTGRLSCSGPNLQQLPRDPAVRGNFIPQEGKVFVCADYSQIELRVAAELSRDSVMLKAYEEGVDLHKLTASLISHKELNEVTKEDRQKAKAFNFGLLYGLGAKKFSHYAKKSYGANVSPQEAEQGVRAFRETYSGYREWQLQQSNNAVQTGYCTTPCGKRRCLDKDNSYGASMNTPVQGGAAECMLYGLIGMSKLGLNVVACVHDEVLVECKSEEASFVAGQVTGCMEGGFLNVFPSGCIKKLVEAKVGRNWAEAKA